MYEGHPWKGEEFGPVEYYWYMRRGYELDMMFDVNLGPFLDFCRERDYRSNRLTMMIAARLSDRYLPQYMLTLDGKLQAARYPAGYVKPVRPGADMLEHIAVREKDGYFVERDIRAQMQPMVKWFAINHPRIGLWLSRWFFSRHETKNNYALMVSRNPLRNLNTRVMFFGAHYRTQVLAIPYGREVTCTFAAPHAFGNINFFEPFLLDFKTWMEDPEQIPAELLTKNYKTVEDNKSD